MLHQRFGVLAFRPTGAGKELAETAHFDNHLPSAYFTDFFGFLFRYFQVDAIQRSFRIFQFLLETVIEIGQQCFPVLLALFHGIQTGLHNGGEFHVDDVVEPFHHQAGDHLAQCCGSKALILLDDVFPILNGRNGGSIGGRTANTLFFHGLDQRGFGVACGRLGKMLLLGDLAGLSFFTNTQIRQWRSHCFGFVILTLFVHGDKAGEAQRRMAGAEGMTGTFRIDGHSVI